MTDALNHPHPDATFETIVDDSITALTKLAAIFTKINNPPVQATTTSPKAAENKHPEALAQPVLTSPVKHKHQTKLQTRNKPSAPANVIESQNLPQSPRVVTPAT